MTGVRDLPIRWDLDVSGMCEDEVLALAWERILQRFARLASMHVRLTADGQLSEEEKGIIRARMGLPDGVGIRVEGGTRLVFAFGRADGRGKEGGE
jgi:hypothetical protein